MSGQAKLWIHGASAGELEDLAAFFLSENALAAAKLRPAQIMITSSSVSAKSRLEAWRHDRGFLYCGPLPPDTPKDCGEFLAEFEPSNFLLSHNDFWPNLFMQWRASKFAKIFYWYFKPKVFSQPRLDLFAGMHPIYLGRSRSAGQAIGDGQVRVIGNLRLDRVLARVSQAERRPHVLEEWNVAPQPGATSIIVGSCRMEDAKLIAELPAEHFKNLHWVVIPHHTDNISEVAQINHLLAGKCAVIVKQGILVEAYKNFDLAWVGGGFSHSGSHNLLEAVAWGIPTICGPNLSPQIDAAYYIESGVLAPQTGREAVELFLKEKVWISAKDKCRTFAQILRNEASATAALIYALESSTT